MLNSYHTRTRAFAKGNVSEENLPQNHKLLHLRIPNDVMAELELQALKHGIAKGRFIVELLRSYATRQRNKRDEG